jgi:predicted alpha/beta hydrolase family esterase
MTFLIVHGLGGYAGIHWQGWLRDQLIDKGHTVLMPDMPNPDHPDRHHWIKTLHTVTMHVDPSHLIIVGHSIGVPTALDMLETIDGKIPAFISVSGFLEDYGSNYNDYFMRQKTIDFERIKDQIGTPVAIFGDNDPYVPQEILYSLADAFDINPIVIPSGGHLNTEAGFTTFPMLLNIIENL